MSMMALAHSPSKAWTAMATAYQAVRCFSVNMPKEARTTNT